MKLLCAEPWTTSDPLVRLHFEEKYGQRIPWEAEVRQLSLPSQAGIVRRFVVEIQSATSVEGLVEVASMNGRAIEALSLIQEGLCYQIECVRENDAAPAKTYLLGNVKLLVEVLS